MEIKGIGSVTVIGFIAEVGDTGRFDNPKQLQKLAGHAIVAMVPENITEKAVLATEEENG